MSGAFDRAARLAEDCLCHDGDAATIAVRWERLALGRQARQARGLPAAL
jgi:hypothetical protein